MSRIEVKILNNGKVELHLSDFQNSSCLDSTRTVERLLGNHIIHRNYRNSQLIETIDPREENHPDLTILHSSPDPS